MKLSRLEIFGFKSFARKLDLKLHGGITAIVGPNGCGKTNVVDAIRWVLGEQRPTHIRLDKMEDVVFKGSGTRRQLGMSEVSLTFENDMGVLPVTMPEVTITRRLFRSGESEYMINRKQCRLADINDMLMDTGAGTDSYSVFEQSMINAILTDKTEDRRHVFEEAAGVTKYKARRKSALNTLLSIEDDLARSGDITYELERRVNSLKRQASKASRYRALKSEIKSRTISLASFEVGKFRKKLSDVSLELVAVQKSMGNLNAESNTYIDEIGDFSKEIVNVEKNLAEIAGFYEANVRALAEKESEMARCESRMESLTEMLDRASENAERSTKALENLAENRDKCMEDLTAVEKNLKEIDSDYDIKVKKCRDFETKFAEKTNIHKNFEQEYRRIEREIASGEAEIKNLKARRKDGENRLRDITVSHEEIGSSITLIVEEISKLQEQKMHVAGEKNDLVIELDTLRKKHADLIKELESLDKRLLRTREQKAALKAETDFIAEIIQSYEGCSEGVKNAVNSKELHGKVSGILSDLVSAKDEFVPAVETALMNSLQSIVVDSCEDAMSGARYLSEESSGRAVFLPLSDKAINGSKASLKGEAGVIGPAYEYVKTDKRYMPIVMRLLEGIFIVDTIDRAFELHNRFSGFSFVAMSGEMVGRLGDIHGGSIKDSEGKSALGRIEKLKNLKKALMEVENEDATLEKRRSVLSSECESLRGDIKVREKGIEEYLHKLHEISSNDARAAAKRDAAVDLRNNLQSESAKINNSFKDFDVKIKDFGAKIAGNSEVFSKLKKKISKISGEIKNHKIECENLRSGINSFAIDRAALKEKRAAHIHEIEVLSERGESLAGSSKRIQREIEEAETEIMNVGDKKKNIREYIDNLAHEHDDFGKRKTGLEKRYSELRLLRNKKENDLQGIRDELMEMSKNETALTLEKDEASMIMQNIIQKLTDDYFISIEEIPPTPDVKDFDPEEEKGVLGELRKKIHNIGDVNLAAETDYNEEKERMDFLAGERDDLVEARDTLMETISKINQAARARFIETFDQINSNFQITFREFFEGGVSSLELAEGEDPLEANILISARPPGKNVKSISLLSSGERALTAISLLFAIYMVKPSPFCILDEVDAPLDDANVDRFLRVIKEFSRKTQFIIVTHNKKTMAQADNLYGITMEEPGLSSLVSVKLSEVDSYSYENEKKAGVSEHVGDEAVEV